MRNGVVILTLATLVFLGWLGLFGGNVQRASVELDRRQGAYIDPRRTLARIQSDLERASAGHQAWPLPQGVGGDALEAIVDAYRLYLDGNTKSMDARLKEIAATAATRVNAAPNAQGQGGADSDTAARALAYVTRLGNAVTAPASAPTTRLMAGLRLVDGVLFLEAARWTDADPLLRIAAEPVAGTWLRLPCRTVIGRVAALREAQAALGDLAGPLLSCPSDNPDLGVLEAQAKAPAMLPTRNAVLAQRGGISLAVPRAEPAPPPAPWDHDTAVAWMDEDPAAAEAALAADASPAGKLDYALFLHAFRPAGPDTQATIAALVQTVDALALARADAALLASLGPPVAYDGGDGTLVASLRLAAATGVAPSYALPCAVLQARPALRAAIQPVWNGARDDILPKSGCATGRGQIRGFPDSEVAAYMTAAEEADGHFLARHRAPAALAASQRAALEALKLAPADLAAAEPPAADHPYQTWGMASLANRAVERRVTALYRDAATRLAGWYGRQGLEAEAAARAAKTGLFRVVWGAACGDGPPSPSLRGMLLDEAPVEAIRSALAGREAPEVTRCAIHAGLDPLLLVAVGHAKALPLLLERGRDVDERNLFGKTALMVAAQNDLVDSARLLLDKGAAINATTWAQTGAGLGHDGRSALMYAAAGGSLAMVKLLLERGADPHMADTRGRRAVDYLLGLGPVPANAVMTAEERAEAARLLF